MSLADAHIATQLLPSCQRAYPDWSALQVSGLSRISSGWECEVYAFVLEGEEVSQPRRDDLILRVYPSDDGVQKARREFDVMSRLQRAGYAVPRMVALEAEGSPLGHPFVIMERIEGPTLGSLLHNSEPRRRQELMARFCGLFADLHAFDWRPYVPDSARYQVKGHFVAAIREWREFLQRLGKREFDAGLDWLDARAGEISPHDLSITHGDFHPWNILIRADGVPFVIDWTQADITDPRIDLAWTLLLMRTIMGPAQRDAVLAGYERAVGAPVDDLEFFEAAASLKRVVGIYVSLTEGPEKVGMRAGAAEMMRQTGPHLATAYALLRERTGLSVPQVETVLVSLG